MKQVTSDRARKKAGAGRPTHPAEDVAYLLRRAGFGASPSDVAGAAKAGLKATITRLVDYDQVPYTISPPDSSVLPADRSAQVDGLAAWWIQQMLSSPRQLQEKMTLFWHGHFATGVQKVRSPLLMYRQNQLFRDNALGRFDDILSAVYKDPAMLIWLDGWRNTKAAPNENWGREVMELFTLGHGNYTEDDVHANSRAFTGWRLDRATGNVFFAPRLFDDGAKTLVGETGNWGGEDAVRILSAHPATGPFLAARLWRFFASDKPPRTAIQKLAAAYYDSNHAIKEMVRTLLGLPEFYSAATRSGHIKSPVEYVVTSLRQLEVANVDLTRLPRTLALLGQELFNPPNVGGWPAGMTWINAATMLGRFNFAAAVTGDGGGQGAGLDVGAIVAESGAVHLRDLVPSVAKLLGISLSPSTRAALLRYVGSGSPDDPGGEAKVRGLIHLALTSPEYQAS